MDKLMLWLTGSLTPAQRVWSAAAPAFILVAIAVFSAIAFVIRNKIRGDFHDKEMEARGSTVVLGVWVRMWFTWMMSPVLNLLIKLRVPPTAITLLSVQLAVGSAFALAAGRMALGGWLFLLAGACDFFDGRLARATNQVHPGGAILDSVVDRYVEGFIYIGLAWFYRSNSTLLIVLFAWFGSMLVPYVRARGEALEVKMDTTGIIQRPERMVILGMSVALSPIVEALWVPADARPPHRLAIAGIAFLAIASQISALQRLFHARRTLAAREHAISRWTAHDRETVALSASLSTVVDLAIVVWLVYGHAFQLPLATLVGCAFGSLVRFGLHRILISTLEGTTAVNSVRFAVVSAGGTALNVGLVTLFLLPDAFPSAFAWLGVRGLVGATWNYPLFKDYVLDDTVH